MCDCHSSRLQGATSLEIEMASESAIDFSSKIPSKGYDKKKKHAFKCKEDAEKHFKSSKRRATLQKTTNCHQAERLRYKNSQECRTMRRTTRRCMLRSSYMFYFFVLRAVIFYNRLLQFGDS